MEKIITFTKEQVEEFNNVFNSYVTLSGAFNYIRESPNTPNLRNKLFSNESPFDDNMQQLMFAKLWREIEVGDNLEDFIDIKNKWAYYVKSKRDSYLKIDDTYIDGVSYTEKDKAKQFETEDEASKWSNPRTKVVYEEVD